MVLINWNKIINFYYYFYYYSHRKFYSNFWIFLIRQERKFLKFLNFNTEIKNCKKNDNMMILNSRGYKINNFIYLNKMKIW